MMKNLKTEMSSNKRDLMASSKQSVAFSAGTISSTVFVTDDLKLSKISENQIEWKERKINVEGDKLKISATRLTK